KSSLRPLMAGSSPSLPDGSNPSAAIVQSASDVQCSRLLKTTKADSLPKVEGLSKLPLASDLVIFRRRLHQLIGRNGCCAASS
ncbi:hypothetical protein, partial [Pseudomonas aeruginosa]|uniref:hypothetical protein n=1 Tax=Pseudomonas aeruginosa TaxID=287 RepID=UPI002FE2B045